jgi:hypothetical protein
VHSAATDSRSVSECAGIFPDQTFKHHSEGPGTPRAAGTSMLGFPGTQKVATINVSSGFIRGILV